MCFKKNYLFSASSFFSVVWFYLFFCGCTRWSGCEANRFFILFFTLSAFPYFLTISVWVRCLDGVGHFN
jgi:hypothetical protein